MFHVLTMMKIILYKIYVILDSFTVFVTPFYVSDTQTQRRRIRFYLYTI